MPRMTLMLLLTAWLAPESSAGTGGPPQPLGALQRDLDQTVVKHRSAAQVGERRRGDGVGVFAVAGEPATTPTARRRRHHAHPIGHRRQCVKRPRSLKMRSRAPSAMPRASSCGWISASARLPLSRQRGRLAKLELRKARRRRDHGQRIARRQRQGVADRRLDGRHPAGKGRGLDRPGFARRTRSDRRAWESRLGKRGERARQIEARPAPIRQTVGQPEAARITCAERRRGNGGVVVEQAASSKPRRAARRRKTSLLGSDSPTGSMAGVLATAYRWP